MADCARCVRNFSVFLIGFLTFTYTGIQADKEILLDTTKELSQLNWTTKVVKPQPPLEPDTTNKGWNEVSSYIDQISDYPLRIYHSCYVSSQSVDNWLRTPFINVGESKSVNVEITFNMRKCVKHRDPSILQQCQETFSLYYYGADRDFANSEMPSWDESTYQLVEKIAAQHLSESGEEESLNVVTKFVSLKPGLRGVYFAFQDTGSCIALVAIKVYSIVCPNVTKNYAFFSQTPTGKNVTSTVEKQGTCVPNSSENGTPRYRCMSDGSWDILLGECTCHPGFEGYDDEKCLPCRRSYYKWSAGNYACQKCPEHSHTEREQSVECQCVSMYYRADKDPKNMACTQPPSKPRHLQTLLVTDKKVQLTWLPPAYTGGRSDITYRIECQDCGSYVMVSPKLSGFNTTIAELSGLRPRYKYRIKVYTENGVSHMTTKPAEYDEVEFYTESSIAEILNLKPVDVGETSITLSWEVVMEDDSVSVRQFEVVMFRQGSASKMVNITLFHEITYNNLKKTTDYYFKVRADTAVAGWGDYSEPIKVTTGSQYETKKEIEQGPSVIIIVGSIIAVILCMAIAAVMIVILLRRNRRNDGKSSDIDGPYHHVTVPLFQATGTIKSYVDPHTYEDPNQAVREFTREIDASHITIESVIGGGEFGDVCKGKLRIPNRPEMSVAIKTLKPGATDKNRLDFLTEASIMGQFDDPNVIFLEGVVTKSNPIMIVTEYMSNGSLDGFLRKNDGQLTVIQLVGMMRGIASGMRYLSEMGYVHRDLAARNILCNESLVCKVADFGLSREVDIDTTDGAYTTKGGKIPVRWTAPEAIAFRKFTSASDVWSFGVVMWEVISYGERPYWNWSNQDVIKAVEKGYRLPPPMECPEAIHQLMLDGWQKERNNRPKFAQIVKTLDKLIRAPELLRKMAKPRPHVFNDNSPPDVTNFASVEEWLNVIKMDRYRDNFVNAGISNMDQVMRITIKDLDTLGITLLGHQKKIMNSVQTLRAQLLGPQVHLPHMQMSEGFLV